MKKMGSHNSEITSCLKKGERIYLFSACARINLIANKINQNG